MGLPKLDRFYTIDEYLEIDRQSDVRYEFIDGYIEAMASESSEHGEISVNIVISLGSQLKGRPCRVRTKDTKVQSGPHRRPGKNRIGMYSYPDVLVICGEPIYSEDHEDIVQNPKVIVEVLSPSTEELDRGEKANRYRLWNKSLDDLLLVSQSEPKVEQYFRKADRSWTSRVYEGMKATIRLKSIRCTLRLVDIYDRVEFDR